VIKLQVSVKNESVVLTNDACTPKPRARSQQTYW
jgi:hypothetical protein